MTSPAPEAPRAMDGEVERLADLLAIRHLRVSVPDFRRRGELQRGRTAEPLLEQRVRCVAVVGAGASSPLHGRGDRLAQELEQRYARHASERDAELFRLERVYGLDPQAFETRLAALSRVPGVESTIRREITRRYSHRHPTILGYELLAHLLKHRFLDAIVSFNFDELLDQSLDDELGREEYRRLVSDRDCVDVIGDPDASDYQPIYAKLHGTASEPDSLRFTREAYYELPQRMIGVVRRIFQSKLCVVVNVGSAMSGFDLHRILRIPEELEIYDLSYEALSEPVRRAIVAERREALRDSERSAEKRPDPKFFLPATSNGGSRLTCDFWLRRLVHAIDARTGKDASPDSVRSLVRFRSVDRHEAVAEVLGPEVTWGRWTDDPQEHRYDYVEYLRQRTVLELAFSAAKARGLAQLSWLAVDRCGTYFEAYRRAAKAANLDVMPWNELRNAAGLDENTWLPDVVEARPDLCRAEDEEDRDDGRWRLREFDSDALAAHVLAGAGRSDEATRARLADVLASLQAGSEVEIHTTDDRVCSKAFNSALTLPTVTSLSVFTAGLFKDLSPEDEVYISCETGEWLLSDDAIIELLKKQNKVTVVTAFKLKADDLDGVYGGRLHHHVIDPWRHNRHMTIVCHGRVPWRAVYFARRLRTPLITPVYLHEPDDAKRLKRAFDLMMYEIEHGTSVADPLPVEASDADDDAALTLD